MHKAHVLVIGKGKLQKSALIHQLADIRLELHEVKYLNNGLFEMNGRQISFNDIAWRQYCCAIATVHELDHIEFNLLLNLHKQIPARLCVAKYTTDPDLRNWMKEHITKSPLLYIFNADWRLGQPALVQPLRQWIARFVYEPTTAGFIRTTQVPHRVYHIADEARLALAAMKTETTVFTPINFPHPFVQNVQVTGVRVVKLHKSKAKPVTIEMMPPSNKNLAIFKVSDDLNMDVFCMNAMTLFNQIWARHNIEYRWEKETNTYTEPVANVLYEIVATPASSGFIELVSAKPMADIWSKNTILDINVFFHGNQLANNDLNEHNITPTSSSFCRMMASGVAMFVTGYVLGIKDRHQDNMMRATNGSLLHIDLQKTFGERVLVEASDFPLPFFFWEWLADQGQVAEFFHLCFLAFTTLVLYKEEIKVAVDTLAQTMGHSTRAQLQLNKTLKENMLFDEFMELVHSGQIKKIIKDTIHHLGV